MPSRSTLETLLVSPFEVLFVHRDTIAAFVRRDIRQRYVNSVMGLSWAIIQPITLLLLYTFVFSFVLILSRIGTISPPLPPSTARVSA